MPGYNELLTRIGVLRQDVAKFYRVVLHSHSLDSKKDYGHSTFRPDTVSTVQSEEAYRRSIMESNLDLIAITDHMKCNLACSVSEEASKRGKCVLPGMEVSLRPKAPWDSFKVHVVAIFPECYALDQISRMLPGQMPPEKDRTGDEEIADIDIPDFVKKVHECGGICIAAHIDSKNGVRKTFRQLGKDGIIFSAADEKLSAEEQKEISTRSKAFLLKAGFDAIEVAGVKDKVHYRWVDEDGRISIPALLTNDSHCPEDLEMEDRHTHIKMTNPCFEDLKLALKFADTRIRFPSDVPSTPSPRILGIQIASASDVGFFKSVEICFSDNLSCFIGPRGSGKSALIESLRYVFGLNRMLKQLDPSGTDLAKKVRDLQAATLTDCIIRVVYCRKDGQINVLESTFDAKQDYTTRVFDLNGNDLGVHDVYATSDYSLRLFGWSEIETLGREPERQRDLLDRIIPGFDPLIDARAKCRASLVDMKREIESSVDQLSTILSRNGGEVKRFKEYQADFTRLNTPEIDKLFVDIDIARAQTVVLNQVAGNLAQWKQQLVDNSNRDAFAGTAELLLQSPQLVRDWWAAAPQTLPINEGIARVKSAIQVAVEELSRLEAHISMSLASINELLQQKEKELREKVGQEATQQVAVELRKTAAERLERVTLTRTEYNKEWAVLQGHLGKWKEGGRDLLKAQAAISDARRKQKEDIESKLNRYATTEMAISITFSEGSDRSRLVQQLGEGFLTNKKLGNYKASMLPWRLSVFCNPIELACALLDKESNRIAQTITVEEQKISVEKATADQLIDSSYPFGHDDDADVDTADKSRLSAILEVGEVEWDDDEAIRLNGKQVNSLSPGQRSSAMLPLVALAENAPLIIDQPEDNLDNKLVGKMMVDILTDLKQHRQIIISTHNPNIVVSGDAEQVVVLDAISDHEGKCTIAGSVDEDQIVKSIIEIMEGGKQAFRNRRLRYGDRV